MKYIIIREPTGALLPKFCCAPDTHRELWALHAAAKPGRTLVSAGFYEEPARGAIVVFGRSDSLNLGPAVGDAAIIRTWLTVTQAAAKAQFDQDFAA